MRPTLVICLLAAAWLPSTATALGQGTLSGQAPQFQEVPGEREFSGELIARPIQLDVFLAAGLTRSQAEARVLAARSAMSAFDVTEHVSQTDEYVFRVPAGSSENEISALLLSSGNFQYVEPNWIVYPIGCPNDALFGNQWHHQANRMQSCDGWDLHTGNPSVAVGICDTGIRTTHEDLQLHRLEGYNAVDRVWENQGGNIGAVHPHGTMTTGCAAANGNNGVGVSGVGWNLSHRMLRVSNSSGGGAFLSDLQHAARTSVENGDRVASVSYSGVDNNSNLTTATYIKSIDGLLVWAAGNDGRNLTFGNRDDDDIIVAGATDSSDSKASFSAFGPFVDLTAPGVGVWTTDSGNNSDYAAVSGTSFACPLTAGLCALIWSADPNLTPDQVEDLLKQAADDLGAAGVDNTYGYGRINVSTAMTLATGGGGTPPVANFTGTPTSGTAPLTVSFSDSSTGSPTSWSWDFGDGGTSTAQNPSYTYNNPGDYTVTLTVTNSAGNDTLVRPDYISVSSPGSPPVADFSGTPTSGTAPLTVSFSDSSTGSPTSWSWDFGDGGTSTAQNPSYTYNNAGDYTVTLTVTNAFGNDTLVRPDYISVSSPGGFTGEGFILSKNSDFSTDDRSYSRATDTLYVLVWSDQLDVNRMRDYGFELRSGKDKLQLPLTNNGDGSFTGSYALSNLPSNKTSWRWRARLRDLDGIRYQPSANISVSP